MNDEQKKAARIKEINDIFAVINNDNAESNLMHLAWLDNQNTQFAEQLKIYQSVLINEVNKLPVQCDHPLRAAHALAKLNSINSFTQQSQFHTALNEFNHEAAHPNFSPLARKVATGIVIGIMVMCAIFFAVTFFAVAVLTVTHGMPLAVSLASTAPISGFISGVLGLASGVGSIKDGIGDAAEASDNIKQAKQQGSNVGKMVNGFFKASHTEQGLICFTFNP
jgi:hypothetical protein